MKSTSITAMLLSIPALTQAWVATTPSSLRLATSTSISSTKLFNGPGGGRESKKIVDDMVDFMFKPVSPDGSVDQSYVDAGPPEDDELAPLIRTICKAADMRKAESVVAMRISKVTTVCGFVVICTGNSRPQNQAIAAAIQDDVDKAYPGGWGLTGNGVPEGTADSGWILLDFGDVMVHVMTPKSRLFYDIEGQWSEKGGEYFNLDDVLLPNSPAQSLNAVGTTMTGISEEDDPFWS
jgi:ribosome-associated protein